ncbi:MAG: hypothetical protein SO013_06030 [Prevotella sp.]|nr:hypothetical protein [Prevotella sp.]
MMNKIKLLLLMLLVSTSVSFAQDKYDTYCELIESQQILTYKITVEIDFGQPTKPATYLCDEQGKKMLFNSMIDVLNYMSKRGWKLVQTYTVTYSGNSSCRYILVKQIEKDEDITKGLYLKKK